VVASSQRANCNLSDVRRSHLVRVVVRSGDPLPQPQKMLAAFPSGDCCLGQPKVKLFAFERSSNVSHPNTIVLFTRIPADISATGFDQLYATFTPAVNSASDKPEQTNQLIEEIN
jgi:hypothetical protein